jgi:hypothetical protein
MIIKTYKLLKGSPEMPYQLQAGILPSLLLNLYSIANSLLAPVPMNIVYENRDAYRRPAVTYCCLRLNKLISFFNG